MAIPALPSVAIAPQESMPANISLSPYPTETNRIANASLSAICKHYACVFGNIQEGTMGDFAIIQENLQKQFNTVLSLLAPGKSYNIPLDIEQILAENKLPAENLCKNGELAYKYYVQKIVSELNQLNDIVKLGNATLKQLLEAIEKGENISSLETLYANLSIYEKEAQEIVKKFSQYAVLKNIDITYRDHYDYNGEKWKQTAHTSFQASSGDVNGEFNQAETEYLDLTKPFTSIIPEVANLDELREKSKTEKYTVVRIVTNSYYQRGTDILTDRYNSSAEIRMDVKDDILIHQKTTVAFFDEFSLLDKLKYIVLYYTKPGTRYVFSGFPCLPNPPVTSTAENPDAIYKDDIKEIGQLEPFFIGYLVDRDGPANTISSFMEIKSAAISAQTKTYFYRLKALQHYLMLLNRGLQELNKSQSSEHARIPEVSYAILSSVGANAIRSIYTTTINGKTEDFFVLQWNNDTGDKGSHQIANGCYLLIKASEEGINAFVRCIQNTNSSFYKHIFNDTLGNAYLLFSLVGKGFITQAQYHDLVINQHYSPFASCRLGYAASQDSVAPKIFRLCENATILKGKKNFYKESLNEPIYILKESELAKLPKEQEVLRTDLKGTNILTNNWATSGLAWNHYDKEKDKTYKDANAWEELLNAWKTCYDTVINNVDMQVKYVNKIIESLRQKVNTFDSSSSTFRNKAYTIYNKTVSNIQ